MNVRDRLLTLCAKGLNKKGLKGDGRYIKRLAAEMKQIDAQNEHDYYLDMFKKCTKENLIFSKNDTNSLVSYLVGIVPDFNIDEPFAVTYGDFPDIDVDYVREVKDYIKNEWAKKEFGEENVCSICNYGSLGIKQALKDMARVYGLDGHEIEAITKKIDDKDDEGKSMVWEKAIDMYPEMRDWCDRNPEVAEAAKMIVGRTKSRGVHAGGLIISSVPITEVVPMEMTDNGVIVSAWGEGLRSQDLSPVGLVKYDVLGISNIYQIALGVRLVKERHGLDSYRALPGLPDWSDTSYLNDPKAIEMADKGDLKCIFQFDGEGIRNLVKKGGVSRFDDLEAYSALFRPGPLGCLPKNSKVKTYGSSKKIQNLTPNHDFIAYLDSDSKVNYTKRFVVHSTGKKKLFKIKTKTGKEIIASKDHLFFIKNGLKKTEDLKNGESVAIIKSIV